MSCAYRTIKIDEDAIKHDLTYSCRTLFYDTFDMTLLHLILVTAPKCGYSSSVGMYRNMWSSGFHTFIDRILCFLNNIMQDLRK